MKAGSNCAMLGSPPRMRGKDGYGWHISDLKRITPAYAGKSSRVSSFLWLFWDHPRVCGEKCLQVPGFALFTGSPPRMRGKAAERRQLFQISGITPAHAGKSARVALACPACWDHPRTCGEKTIYADTYPGTLGSPPHMRGKVLYYSCVPATLEDHPRTCGEKHRNIR